MIAQFDSRSISVLTILASGSRAAVHGQAHGINDVLIAVVDGPKGFPEVITWYSRRPSC